MFNHFHAYSISFNLSHQVTVVFSTGADAAAASKNWASDTRVLAFNDDVKTGAGAGGGARPAKAKKLVR
jgi:hypothetical protein